MSSLSRLAAVPDSATTARSPKDPIRVVLADDHTLMRRSLRRLLDSEEGVEVVAEANDLTAVARHVYGHLPHVLVLDLGMPDGTSLDTIRWLRAQVPDTQIVVLSMQDDPAFARRALETGAVGFVLKELADSDLPEAIRSAVRGAQFVSPRLSARLRSLSGIAYRGRPRIRS